MESASPTKRGRSGRKSQNNSNGASTSRTRSSSSSSGSEDPDYIKRNRKRDEVQEKFDRENSAGERARKPIAPLHDPNDSSLFSGDHTPLILSKGDRSVGTVDVVVDPRLSEVLQEHQREGVEKMYQRLIMTNDNSDVGFILADVMGLGKTIQCITVLWTFLCQSPKWNFEEQQIEPTIKKAIIVCPASLIEVWHNEIKNNLAQVGEKNLHSEMKLCVINDRVKGTEAKERRVEEFLNPMNRQQCLLISYNGFTNMALTGGPLSTNPGGIVGLIVCDEGHMLKSTSSHRYKTLDKFKVKRKIILTGTPLQNHLGEYWAIIRMLDDDFRMEYPQRKFDGKIRKPIDKYVEDKLSGEDAERPLELDEIRQIVEPFFLRRTKNTFISDSVKRFQHIICCKMESSPSDDSNIQMTLYNNFIQVYSDQLDILEKYQRKKGSYHQKGLKPAQPVTVFQAIRFLQLLCAHPKLIESTLKKWVDKDVENYSKFQTPEVKQTMTKHDYTLSAKMRVLIQLLQEIRKTGDRVVVASSYTTVLRVIEKCCKKKKFPYTRFDSKTSTAARQGIIKKFNDPTTPNMFILTLSTKAGGYGISLVGANHFVMFDPDWNPHNDDQAMGRIYRLGQKKNCHFYRLLTTGSIEEAIFQKQITKKMLAGQVLSEGKEEDADEEQDDDDDDDDSVFFANLDSESEDEDFDWEDLLTTALSKLARRQGKDKEVKKRSVTMKNIEKNYFYLRQKIQEKREDDTKFFSLLHDAMNCKRCPADAMSCNPLALGKNKAQVYDELNLHEYIHIIKLENDGRCLSPDSKVLLNAWTSFIDDISMVFTKELVD